MILTEQLGIKQVTAVIVETDGSEEEIFVELPFLHADKVRVLLTGSSAIENLQTNFKAETANQRNGERYSLIDIRDPERNLGNRAGKKCQRGCACRNIRSEQ